MTRVVAMLDPPSRRSFGISPVVVRDDDGALRVCGYTFVQRGMRTHDLTALLESNQARTLDVAVATCPDTTVAWWIGTDFEDDAHEAGLPVPRPFTPYHQVPGGTFWLRDAHTAFARRRAWIRHAFELVCIDRSAALAELLAQADPASDESGAAQWLLAEDKTKVLAWCARLDHAGRTEGQLRATYATMCHT